MGLILKRGIKMLWRRRTDEEKPLPTMIELVQAEAHELEKVQRWTCSHVCKYFDQVSNSYPETNSPCDHCEFEMHVIKQLKRAGLLGVVYKGENDEGSDTE